MMSPPSAPVSVIGTTLPPPRKAVYVGSREWDFGMNYYVFQDIGKDSYLLIFIHDKANQEPAAVISEFLVP